jgi:hypothetical protein
MKTVLRRLPWMLLMLLPLLLPSAIYAEKNAVLGKIDFEGRSHVERTSGVWIDGQYVGYLKELKGDKEVLLLPGDHVITVRQDGYQDFTKQVHIEPGQTKEVRVSMEKAATLPMPAVLATVKIDVNPSRAAVFMDGLFVGHVGEFKGPGKGMLVAPGTHQIEVALPGFQTFTTEISPLGNQKVEIKTDLVNNHAPLAEPLLERDVNATGPSVPAGAMASPMK